MTLPVMIDLMALARATEAGGENAKLAEALKSAWRAQSCLGDLNQAADLCRALDMVWAGAGPTNPAIRSESETAMLAMAVINYARATHSGGKDGGRGSIQLNSNKLTPQQRDDHEILVDIRNRALGHVEPSKAIGGAKWHSELLFARQNTDGSWGIASATQRITFHKETFDRLKRQLPVAINILKKKSQRRLAAVATLFNRAPISEEMMLQHPLDPVAVFGSEDRARYVLGGLPGSDLAIQG